MAGSFYGLSFLDASNEVGRTEFNVGDLTVLTLTAALAQMGALTSAIDAVVLGTIQASRWGDNDVLSNTPPTDKHAQRGVKWTLLMEDNTLHTKFKNLLPTADLSSLPSSTVEDLDLTAGAGLALKSALEALVKSPAGNGVTLLRCYYSD